MIVLVHGWRAPQTCRTSSASAPPVAQLRAPAAPHRCVTLSPCDPEAPKPLASLFAQNHRATAASFQDILQLVRHPPTPPHPTPCANSSKLNAAFYALPQTGEFQTLSASERTEQTKGFFGLSSNNAAIDILYGYAWCPRAAHDKSIRMRANIGLTCEIRDTVVLETRPPHPILHSCFLLEHFGR